MAIGTQKGTGRDESLRMDQLGKKFEVCQVFKVWTHNQPGDMNWQTCDVIIQDSVPLNPAGVGKDGPAVRLRVPVRQGHIGNRSGTPWTPRVGDSVLVGFYMNDRPIILGTLPPQHQLPVCRSSANPSTSKYGAYEDWVDADYHNYYDWRFKLVQWLHVPRKTIVGADGKTWYTTFDHGQVVQAGKLRPVCLSYFDKTRDCMAVFECKKGKADPDNCKTCELNGDDTGDGPDYIKAENEPMSGALAAMNTWLKILSTDYEGSDDIPRRFKLHWSCGSLFCADSKCGNDTEGRIWLEAQKAHVGRAHIHFRAEGANNGANLSLRSAPTAAAHIELYGVTDPKKGRIWLSNEDIGNYIDIKETDEIVIHAAKIVLDGNVEITGNNAIDGACFHGVCSCKGAQDFTDYSESDPNDHITIPSAPKCSCSGMTCGESCYTVQDFLADYFEQCRLLFNVMVSACSGGGAGCCGLTNAAGTDILSATGYKLFAEVVDDSGLKLKLVLLNGGTVAASDSCSISAATKYYCQLRKAEGETEASLEVYSDQNMTALVDTLTISDENMPNSYRYLYGLSSLNSGEAAKTISCIMGDLTVAQH